MLPTEPFSEQQIAGCGFIAANKPVAFVKALVGTAVSSSHDVRYAIQRIQPWVFPIELGATLEECLPLVNSVNPRTSTGNSHWRWCCCRGWDVVRDIDRRAKIKRVHHCSG
jgi:hypothetical protein